MAERIRQSTDEVLRISVSIRGTETTMSLIRQSETWALNGGGISGTAPTPDEVFVTTLGIFDGKKAARRWRESRSMEGGGENGKKNG